MIFYLAKDETGKVWIKGTQADAKEVNKDFQQIDIPDDKFGRMAWVQQMLDETLNADTVPETSEAEFAQMELRQPEPVEPRILPPSVQTITEWLLDMASQREIESIYSAIGCRVGELLRENRA